MAVVALLILGGCTSNAASPAHSSDSTRQHSAASTRARSSVVAPAPPSSVHRAPKRRTVTILGTGDVLIHPPLWRQAHRDALAEGRHGYDFGPMYASIGPDVRRADLAICEEESPLAPPQGPFTGWPQFSSPPQVLTALKRIGYDSCTTASNHSIDEGYAGVKRTLDEIDAAGLAHTGSARSAAEARRPLILTMANGVKVAQLAYSFGFNGLSRPPGEPWLANLTNIPDILAAARRAKRAGADIVVLSMHWGIEYERLATSLQREQARQLLASPDIDLILGDHAHVIQPMQKIGDKWVIYCMGNLVARHEKPIDDSREGVLAKFTFTEIRPHVFRVSRAEAIPVWMEIEPELRLVDLPRALADPATMPEQRALYQKAWGKIAGYLDAYGAVKDGLVIER